MKIKKGDVRMEKSLIDNMEEFEEDTQKDKYLTFKVDEESYGIGIHMVTEIIGIEPITTIPELPDHIRGIVNLRGKIIPVMDVRMRFKKPFMEYNDRTCIIVIEVKDIDIGLIVDSVSDVLNIPEEEIVAPPEINRSSNRYIQAIGKIGDQIVLLLDCNKLLKDEDYQIMSEIENNLE